MVLIRTSLFMGYKFSLLKIIAFGTSTCQRCLETLTATTTVSRNWKDVATRQVDGALDSKFHLLLVGKSTLSHYGCPKVLHHIEYSNYRLFVPKTFRSQERKVPMENFRSLGTKVPGTFVPRERKGLGTKVPTFVPLELSFLGNESSP